MGGHGGVGGGGGGGGDTIGGGGGGWGPRTREHGCSGSRMLLKHERYYIGHGCSGKRMLLKHEHYYGLGMDSLVAVCS